MRFRYLTVLAAMAVACSGTGGSNTTTFGMSESATAGLTTSGAASTTTSGASSGTADTGSSSSGSSGSTSTPTTTGASGVRFDLGKQDLEGITVGDGTSGEPQRCTKVDLLFVIDNSGSMQNEQEALVASFPGFVDGMRTQLADVLGYNVGVTTTDVFRAHLPPLCEIMGSLVTSTVGAGSDSSNMECGPYVSGGRYMTEEDDLAAKFACAATVGTVGNPEERPIEAALAALSPEANAPGGCNEGFLRHDALLVVVVITDET